MIHLKGIYFELTKTGAEMLWYIEVHNEVRSVHVGSSIYDYSLVLYNISVAADRPAQKCLPILNFTSV